MLKTFVINLASSTERYEKVKTRLEELRVEFERFEAVDGRNNPHPLFSRYDDHLRKRFRRKPMSPGELGCFASHYLLWQKALELNQAIVVMEDDVVIDDSFVEALVLAEGCIETFHYLRLAGTSLRKSPYEAVGKVGSFDLVDHVRGPTGTLCYVIHPVAAKKMLEASGIWCLAVDDHLDRYWVHGVDCFSLMPFPVRVGSNPSDIEREDKDRRLWSVILREVFRRIEFWRRDAYRKKIAASKERQIESFFRAFEENNNKIEQSEGAA